VAVKVNVVAELVAARLVEAAIAVDGAQAKVARTVVAIAEVEIIEVVVQDAMAVVMAVIAEVASVATAVVVEANKVAVVDSVAETNATKIIRVTKKQPSSTPDPLSRDQRKLLQF
jgi:hypothetical protein